MVEQPGGSTLVFMVAGVCLRLGLMTVVSYRMNRRRYWLAAPWALTATLAVIQYFTIRSVERSVIVELDQLALAVELLEGASSSSVFVMLVALAIAGVRRSRSQAEVV